MIDRYSRPAMAEIFSDAFRMQQWLRVEQTVTAVLADAGVVPAEAAAALEGVTAVDPAAVRAREEQTHHDLAAFVDVVAEMAPDAKRWIHYGLTSSDVVDTALGLQLQRAGALLMAELAVVADAVLHRAYGHRDAIMLGRTHGMPAEVTTFGAKLAGWWHQLERDRVRLTAAFEAVAVGKLSGTVGTYSVLAPQIEEQVLERLGLGIEPGSTQIVQRDRHAQLVAALATLAATLERGATEIRLLQRAELAEAAEPFAAGQKGSSAMPHKRNPVVCERICGLARYVRGLVAPAIENVAVWHERDISHSSVERVILPDALLAVDYMLDRFRWVVEGMHVDEAAMAENVEQMRDLIVSHQVLSALVRHGMERAAAYEALQKHFTGSEAAPELEELLGERLAELSDPRYGLRHIESIFERLPAGR